MESRIIVTAELSQIRGHFTQISRVAFCVPLVNLSLVLPFNHFLIFNSADRSAKLKSTLFEKMQLLKLIIKFIA